MTGPLIIDCGTDEQKARYLPGILDGSEIWCLGYSEPTAGSDLSSLVCTSTREGEQYRIRGRKIWTSFAHHADRCRERENTAQHQQHRHRQFDPKRQGGTHSITSPRSKNLAIAAELTKPKIAINNAASKYMALR